MGLQHSSCKRNPAEGTETSPRSRSQPPRQHPTWSCSHGQGSLDIRATPPGTLNLMDMGELDVQLATPIMARHFQSQRRRCRAHVPIPKDEPCAALARGAIDVQVLRGGARCAYDSSATQSPWSIGLQLKTTCPKSWMHIGAGGEIPASQDQDLCPTPQHTPTDMHQTCATGLARLQPLGCEKASISPGDIQHAQHSQVRFCWWNRVAGLQTQCWSLDLLSPHIVRVSDGVETADSAINRRQGAAAHNGSLAVASPGGSSAKKTKQAEHPPRAAGVRSRPLVLVWFGIQPEAEPGWATPGFLQACHGE